MRFNLCEGPARIDRGEEISKEFDVGGIVEYCGLFDDDESCAFERDFKGHISETSARYLTSVPRGNIDSILHDDRIRVYAHPGHRQSNRLVKSSLRGLTALETIDWVGLEYLKNYRDWICHDSQRNDRAFAFIDLRLVRFVDRCSFSSVTLTASLGSKKIGSLDTNRCKSDPENVTESSYDPTLRDSLSQQDGSSEIQLLSRHIVFINSIDIISEEDK
ncbi:hypothetical protein HZH68_003335 [Vespula germanica]|uniref:Uncharacterized protein n=1 Tax=Vespula germanica TaxID=30212 RepID=A0A834NNW3_VESGE|nr:hypothetical protein HZH68_003335 [Vespula germanica]